MKDNSQRRKLVQYWFVIRELTSREIKRKYSRSKLGILWSVLSPILYMAVISLVFSKMFQRSIENFPVYYLCGYLIWSFFTNATNGAMSAFVDNKTMLIKVKLPMSVFVLARVYTGFINFLYTLIAFVVVLIVFRITPHLTLLFFPVIILCIIIFIFGVSYILSTAYVFWGDVKYLYSVFLTLLMYMSALFYPISMLPDILQIVLQYNPVFLYIDALRDIVLYNTIPDAFHIFKMFAFAIVIYVIGFCVFRTYKNKIMQKL